MPDSDTTDTVLRILSQAGIGVSPAAIAVNVDAFTDQSTTDAEVRTALDELEERDLVRALEDTDYYRITDHGRDYVRNELAEGAPGYVD